MSTVVAELPDLYEVVNGQVVEQPEMSARAVKVASDLSFQINSFSRKAKLGEAVTELLIAMPDRFEHNRRPDVCYISYAKWPKGREFPNDNALDVVPDLCVEVVSPNDQIETLFEKIEEYFVAGVPLVWVVYPNQQWVDVYTSNSEFRRLRRIDTLTGETVIPGFELPLAELFPIA